MHSCGGSTWYSACLMSKYIRPNVCGFELPSPRKWKVPPAAHFTMKQIFTKKEAPGDWGKKPEERTPEELITYGIVNIDKPKGPTSHQVSDYVQKIVGLTKAGHSGTLEN